MKVMPKVVSMKRINGAPLGDRYSVQMFDHIKSEGSVQYAFLLAVYDKQKQEPVYIVASEVNALAAVLGGGSHYLGVFDGSGHSNLGASNDWGNPRKFFARAIRLAADRFGVSLEGE